MREKQIVKLFRKLGGFKFIQSTKGLTTNCPFYNNHIKGSDEKPSLFVTITSPQDDRDSFASCHSCGFRGNLERLLWELKKIQTVDIELIEYVARVEQGEEFIDDLIDSIPNYAEVPNYVRVNKKVQVAVREGRRIENRQIVLPDGHRIVTMENGVSAAQIGPGDMEKLTSPFIGTIPPYWFKRGFSEATAREFSIGTHQGLLYYKELGGKRYYTDHGQRMLIPILDFQKKIVGWSARAMEDEESIQTFRHPTGLPLYLCLGRPKYLHCPVFKRNEYLYGEHLLDSNYPMVFLMEGFFDVINFYRHGFKNGLAMCGTHLSAPQIEKLLRWTKGKTLVLVPDGDDPGKSAMKLAASKLQGKTYFKVVDGDLYQGRDPGDLSFDEISLIMADLF